MAVKDRKQKEKEQRYNSILDAAQKILTEKGLTGLSIELVAKETELAKGTLYLYFKNKEDIVSALSLKSRIELLSHFRKVTKKVSHPIEKLKSIAIASFDFYKKYPFYFELIDIYEANFNLEESEEMKAASQHLMDFINEITIDAKAKGHLHSALDPRKYTFCLWGMVIGMAQLLKVKGSMMKGEFGFSEKDIIHTFMVHLEKGMAE